jgi:hypothetical protein
MVEILGVLSEFLAHGDCPFGHFAGEELRRLQEVLREESPLLVEVVTAVEGRDDPGFRLQDPRDDREDGAAMERAASPKEAEPVTWLEWDLEALAERGAKRKEAVGSRFKGCE